MNIMEFIRPELFILIVFAYVIGMFLKLVPTFKAEWKIPFIIWGVMLIMSLLYIAVLLGEGFTAPVIIAAIIQGTLIAAAAVFGNELLTQATKKKFTDNYEED